MKRRSFTHTAVTMLVTSCVTCGPVLAETEIMGGKALLSGEVTAGIQQKTIDGAQEKFEEYRDINNGPVLNDLQIRVDGVDSPYYLDLRVKDAVQDDEYYRLTGGRHGKYKFGLSYDSIPHNFSTGRFLLNDLGGGRFAIGDAVQQQLQDAEILRSQRYTYDPATGASLAPATDTEGAFFINPADAQNMALDAGMVNTVNNLYGSAGSIKFGLTRKTTGVDFEYQLLDDVKVWTKVSNERRTGNRRINQGTYERYNNGNTVTTAGVGDRGHLVDYFVAAGIELPETIDYTTTTFNVGTGVYKKNWLADLEYSFTNFQNKVNSLVWDNPFRLNSAAATAAGASTILYDPGTSYGNPFNRGRSALGQMTLSPDSQSHDISVSGSIELPLHSRFTGTVSYGWITQDDAFDPYTLNDAIRATTVAGDAPTAALASTTALPQGSLNGEVATLFQSYQLTSKPTDSLAVTARYRYYDYDNKSDNITFPGYAAFGDSFWRTFKNDVTGANDAPVRNEALSFTRQNAELALDYHLFKPLTVIAEGFWEGWDREQLRINDTTEVGVGTGFIYKPTRTAKLKGTYRYAHRTVDGYKPGDTAENPEAVGLANYDWAERVRHKADLRLNVTPVEAVSVGLSGQYLNDEFGGDNRFGLKENDSITGSIDVSYAVSEALSLYASYVKEYRKGFMQNAAKDDAFDNPATPENETTIGNFNPENYWNSNIFEKVDTIGLGATVQIIPGKLTVNTNYSLSYSKMDVNTYNPNGAVKLANAAAQDWPTITNRYQEVKTDIGYSFTDNLKAGVTYLYEWYMLDDFANTGAYMAGSSFENSTKYVFTGANQFSYDAHVVGAYLTYKF